jgi:DNA-directed RNA polymerase subunit RPC12/RpoP
MKFLCLDCDEPMRLHGTEGPHDGSLTVTFRCPTCGFRVAMLTNPLETQMVRSLGVSLGPRPRPVGPFEHLRASLAGARPDAFAGEPPAEPERPAYGRGAASPTPATESPAPPGRPGAAGQPAPAFTASAAGTGSGCPFAAALGEGTATPPPAGVSWAPEAEARLARVPEFIRPMARRAIERWAESQGHALVTEAVMDEARGAFGM